MKTAQRAEEPPEPGSRTLPASVSIPSYLSNPPSNRLPRTIARRDRAKFCVSERSADFLNDVIGSFRRHTRFPSEGVAAPANVQGVGWSDHWSFWQAWYPALMVTDTPPCRYPHYHHPTDTPDKVDYDRAARVVAGVIRVTRELASSGARPADAGEAAE